MPLFIAICAFCTPLDCGGALRGLTLYVGALQGLTLALWRPAMHWGIAAALSFVPITETPVIATRIRFLPAYRQSARPPRLA